MGKAVKSVGGFLGIGGGGGSAGPQLDMSRFDFRKDVDERTRPSREASLKLLTELQEQAAGRGPSLAEAQLKSATSRNLAQTLAAAQAARGGSPALQQRELQRAQTETGRQLAEQSAIARMQEQQAAQAQLGQQAIAQQAQDLQQITGPGQILAGGEQARFAGDVARRQGVQQQQSALLGQFMQAGASGAAALASDENKKVALDKKQDFKARFADALKESPSLLTATDAPQRSMAKISPELASLITSMSAPQVSYGKTGANMGNLLDTLMAKSPAENPAASISSGMSDRRGMTLMASDERGKTGAVNPKKDIQSFLDAIEARSYAYKNPSAPGAAPGKRYGVMAQDLENSEVGRTFVQDTPAGKMVDTTQGFGAVLAAQAELNRRLKALEKKKG